ncbi:MAG: hypothetical protein NVSMB46_04600 [Candidatus Saccharimonadales bacterium]
MSKTKIIQLITWQRVFALAGLIFLISFSMVHGTHAQTFTQGYASDKPLQRGMIVQINKKDTTKVEPVTTATMDQIYGVVVDANDASVTLGADNRQNYIATTGQYDALVSTQNGPVATGDFITVSAIDGIGAKASSKEPYVLGRAIEAFDGKTKVVSTIDQKDSSGHSQTLALGRVKVSIVVARNPLLKGAVPDLPEFLRKATDAIAGKPVNAAKAYIGVVIFIVSTVIAGSLMYSGIKSAIISIGRNPLSKKSIFRSMTQVILTGLIIFISGIFGVYLLLKL